MGLAEGATICVLAVSGATVCQVTFTAAMTVADLKSEVNKLEGTEVLRQRLLCGNVVLSDRRAKLDEVLCVVPEAMGGGEAPTVTLVRLPPVREVSISGGQGRHLTVDGDLIVPGKRSKWLMWKVDENEFQFEFWAGAGRPSFVGALSGDAYTPGSALRLEVEGGETWSLALGDKGVFYDWVRGSAEFAVGIRRASQTVEQAASGEHDYWRWQSEGFHLASKKGSEFRGDEALWIADWESGSVDPIRDFLEGAIGPLPPRPALMAERRCFTDSSDDSSDDEDDSSDGEDSLDDGGL